MNNLMHEWKVTLPVIMLSLFMTIVTGGFDFLVFFSVLYYITLREFNNEGANEAE